MPDRTSAPVSSPTLPALTFSAFASGFAALVLELQWSRQLALTFGGSSTAIAAVLSAFMFGLGIGSLVGGRAADRMSSPAKGIVGLELALAAIGPILGWGLFELPAFAALLLPDVTASSHPLFTLSRFILALSLLIVPTTLMGATFPMLVRAASDELQGFHRGIGRLYAANTIGGVTGVLAAGFVVLPISGIPGSITLAATANLVAAGAALRAHRRVAPQPRDGAAAHHRSTASTDPLSRTLLAAAACSGALVLGTETLWFRALKLVLANSTTTLTLLLAVTLTGLGCGAALGTPFLRRATELVWWARLQLAAVALLLVQAAVLPEIAAFVRLFRPDTGWARTLAPPLAVGGLLILPVTLLFGAAWPLLLRAATPRVADGGRRVGHMGIVNSIGAAVGAAAAGMLVLPIFGFGRAMLIFAALGAGTVVLGLSHGVHPMAPTGRRSRRIAGAAGAFIAAAAVISPAFGRVPLPSMTLGASNRELLLYRETASGTVMVTEEVGSGARAMYVDNNAVIGATYEALKVARMLGLVPILVHPEPDKVLVIGFGAGITSATVAAAPGVGGVDVVEIVPGVVDAASLFLHLNHDVARAPKVRFHANDGRNHLLLHAGPWDVITCDPVHPLYGSAPLYSLDFFELCRRRLAPGGVVCQYLPLHRMPEDAFRRAIATFHTAFPESWVLFGLGHAMLIGSSQPIVLDWQLWRRTLETHPLRGDLAGSALDHPAQIAALLQLDPEGCARVGRGKPSTDRHPRLEFLAPAAYRPGLWPANARLLVEAYTSPIPRIVNLPSGMEPRLQRLVAGKRLLLFSLLERSRGNLQGANGWLTKALEMSGDDPEVRHYGRQLTAETRATER